VIDRKQYTVNERGPYAQLVHAGEQEPAEVQLLYQGPNQSIKGKAKKENQLLHIF